MPPLTLAITNRHPRLRLRQAELNRMFAVLEGGRPALRLPRAEPLVGELSLVFLTDEALATIHGEFMDDPSTTDVITFEGEPAAGTAGEICVSADTAARFVGLPVAGRSPRPALLELFAAELTLYLVHGWLHLSGHDDLVPAKKRKMRAAESRALALLRRKSALPTFGLKL